MRYMRKAIVAGVVGGLLALATAFANAVPQITADEVWVMVAAVLGGFVTGGMTYLVKNDPDFRDEEEPQLPAVDAGHRWQRPDVQ